MKMMRVMAMSAAFSAVLIFAASEVDAQRGGGRGGGASRANTGGGGANRSVRASSGSNISTASRGNANVNRGTANRSGNRNVNTGNINTGDINVNVDNNCCNGGWGYGAHPVARGAAIATTAAVMGSYYNSLPAGCVTVVRIGINYSRCGSTWYQPIYSGATVRYQVVSEP